MQHHVRAPSTASSHTARVKWHWRSSQAGVSIVLLLLIASACLSSGNPTTPTSSGSNGAATTTGGSGASTSTTGVTGSSNGSGSTATSPSSTSGPVSSSTTIPTPTSAPVDLSSVTIGLEPIFGGLNQPVFLTDSGDGRGDIYIVEKTGKILLVKGGKVQSQPFLDITSRVRSASSEQGLFSVAFHPNYADNGFLFVDYTDTGGNTVVARFTVSPDRTSADPNSFKKILGIEQPYANHNGGQIAFGPDGMLWIGAGDGGSEGDPQGNGQKTNTLLGKILRIDVDHGDPYAIPPDNPFADGKNGKPEIWAYGLRNPWRFSFDRATHDLYIGDVGQSQWEEIDFVSSDLHPGLNFGWKTMEGTHCYRPSSNCDTSGLTMPVTEYSHAPGNCSVTGGYVYRGSQYKSIDGAYFFTDYCSGTIWGLTRDASGKWSQSKVAQGSAGYSSFGQDGNGELYVCDLSNGTIYHLTATSK